MYSNTKWLTSDTEGEDCEDEVRMLVCGVDICSKASTLMGWEEERGEENGGCGVIAGIFAFARGFVRKLICGR